MSIRNSVGRKYLNEGFAHYVYGTFWHKPFDETDELTFYPQLWWNKFKVTPVYWHKDSVEPMLLCRMETHDLGAKSEKEYEQMVRDLRTLGWDWDPRDAAHMYIHVDDLEKIEGPPPSGAF